MEPSSQFKNDFDAVIIGAGPAGLFCAIRCAEQGASVCILEKNSRPGKKLLITGSGQCNITHSGPIEEFLSHYGGREKFVKPALYGFTGDDLVRFFAERGLGMYQDEKGKLFPETHSAGDILDVLLGECKKREVTIRADEPAAKISACSSGFDIRTAKARYLAPFAVITTGGKSYPATGSTGDGYAFARSLGHTIIPPAPALVPVMIRDYRFAHCSGISLPGCTVRHYRSGKKIGQWTGDVLFTHRGLSGPGILDNSRYVLAGDELRLSLVAFDSVEDFGRDLVERSSIDGKKTLKNVLAMYGLPDRIVEAVLQRDGIPADLRFSQLDRGRRSVIAQSFAACPFVIEKPGSYGEAMVTRGGVALDEISGKTMGSRRADGLFFAGEVVDVDGDTGGYNLQWAFSSGFLAGQSIARMVEKKRS